MENAGRPALARPYGAGRSAKSLGPAPSYPIHRRDILHDPNCHNQVCGLTFERVLLDGEVIDRIDVVERVLHEVVVLPSVLLRASSYARSVADAMFGVVTWEMT